jgi:hypothetical protein
MDIQVRRILEFLRQRKAEQQLKQFNPYCMLPAADGGESYSMECTFCRKKGNIISQFQHAANCSAGK